jgi:3-hydroxybutyryl-CoA dehydrogenase
VRATRRLVLCANASLAALEGGGRNVGFHALPPLSESRLVELTRGARTDDEATAAAESFFRSLGKHIEWVGDGPGLVLGRIVCQLVNEGSFAVAEGVGSAADVDAALELGFNYPRGPLGWGDEIGLGQVLATLDGLYRELHEERYRASPLLRRMVHEGRTGRAAGEGFFDYRG